MNTSHDSTPRRTNLVRRVSHARAVVVLEERAANDAGLDARLRVIGERTKAQLEQLARLETPFRRIGPPVPRHIVDRKLARVTIARMRASRIGRGDLPFWTLTNYAEALLRSAISEHVRTRGR